MRALHGARTKRGVGLRLGMCAFVSIVACTMSRLECRMLVKVLVEEKK